MYVQYKVNVSENQVDTLKNAIGLVQIRMSARQVAKNVSYTGGFLGMLARSQPYTVDRTYNGSSLW